MNVVVIGGGIAGMEFLRHASKLPISLTLIEPKDNMVCQALLPELLSGKVEKDEICVNVGEFCSRMGIEFVRDRAEYIENGVVLTNKGKQVEYDVLIIAVGADINYYGIEGAEKTYNINTLDAALRARRDLNKVRRVLVIGSGVTGIETALELAELGFDVCIVECMNRILPTFNLKISNFVYKVLKKENIEVRTSTAVLKVDREGVITNSGRIYGDMVIWCAGLRPARFLEDLDVPKERGWVRVDRFLRAGDFFVIGDCAHVEIDGKVATKTAFEAEKQAKHVMDNVGRILREEKLRGYKIGSSVDRPIAMITLARNRAILVYKGVMVSRPMSILYRLKKIMVNKFLAGFT